MLLQLPAHQESPSPSLNEEIPEADILGISDIRLLDPLQKKLRKRTRHTHIYCTDPTPCPTEIPFPFPQLQGSYAFTTNNISVVLSCGRLAHRTENIHWLTPPPLLAPPPLSYYALPNHPRPHTIDIIGAGITGIVTAYVLAQKGFSIRLFERHPQPCAEASGNPHALVYANLSPFDQIQPRFYQSSLFSALRYLHNIHTLQKDVFLPSGILCTDKHYNQWKNILSPSETAIQRQTEQLWLPHAGVVHPQKLAQFVLEHPNISFFPLHNIENLHQQEDHLVFCAQGTQYTSEHIIICTAHHIDQFPLLSSLSLHKSSGQISYQRTPLVDIEHAHSAKAYLTPFWHDVQCFGATYHLREEKHTPQKEDHLDNIARLRERFPTLSIDVDTLLGRVGTRAQTNNFLPIIGPLPDTQWYTEQYAKLKDGLRTSSRYPIAKYVPNISVHLGHGSKGFSQAWIGAEILAAQIQKTPLPIDIDVYQALHPARFLVKQIHKPSTKNDDIK